MKKQSIFLSLCFSLLANSVSSEVWLSDSLYLESQHHLFSKLPSIDKDKQQENTLNTLSQFHLNQLITANGTNFADHFYVIDKLHLAGKLASSNQQTLGQMNAFNLVSAPRSLPYFSFTLGRMLVNYRQEQLFNTSLSKNQDRLVRIHRDKELNYSQGLLTQFQLGFIRQSVLINQYKNQAASYHYRLNLGIPGYKLGPLQLVLEQLPKGYLQQEKVQQIALLGASLQWPMPKLWHYQAPGDWQWSFQFGQGFKQNTHAWQTSLSWLGFIKHHRLGLLWANTDQNWYYSSDFERRQRLLAGRYQLTINQNTLISAALQKSENQIKDEIETSFQLALEINF